MAPRLFACFRRGSSASESKTTADSATEEHRRAGPVVVELFSSQGCGTSPEAEAIATRLAGGEIVDVPVLVLAFHVDYWDYRGWKDPFGSSAWTVRQKAYVESMRLDTLYTPQIVVQGRDQCLGNEEGSIAAAVCAAPRFPSPTMQASPNKESFKNYTKGNLEKVYLGNNNPCSIVGQRDVDIKLSDVLIWRLKDVKYIFCLKMNLFSMSQIADSSHMILFT